MTDEIKLELTLEEKYQLAIKALKEIRTDDMGSYSCVDFHTKTALKELGELKD